LEFEDDAIALPKRIAVTEWDDPVTSEAKKPKIMTPFSFRFMDQMNLINCPVE